MYRGRSVLGTLYWECFEGDACDCFGWKFRLEVSCGVVIITRHVRYCRQWGLTVAVVFSHSRVLCACVLCACVPTQDTSVYRYTDTCFQVLPFRLLAVHANILYGKPIKNDDGLKTRVLL